MTNIKDRAFELLKEWCDELITLKVTIDTKELYGGILCPACAMIHGRCGDLVFPLMYLYSVTHDEKYRTAAKDVFNWSEENLLREDGSYYNDIGSTWRGITVFSALSVGEALIKFGDLLDDNTGDKWNKAFLRLTDASLEYFNNECKSTNINYYAGLAALLALTYKHTGKETYLNLSNKYEAICHAAFDESGLLTGEGKTEEMPTKKGCRPIDMGYNLEESLPLLIMHSVWLCDEEKISFYTARTLDHLELIMPDGGIDNSFGTRMNKWTYWGSRTSDGMHEGLVYIADRSPVIARALAENFKLLERCTHRGLLHAGLMQNTASQPPCIHHSFTHAKSLAAFCLKLNSDNLDDSGVLTREIDGIRKYQNGNLITVTRGDFTATINATDTAPRENDSTGGGTLSLLWHKKYGAILAATLHNYYAAEPHNMQYLRRENSTKCMSARFVSRDGNYSSDLDKSITLSNVGWTVFAKNSDNIISFKYDFFEDGVEISVNSETDGEYILPIVCDDAEAIKRSEKSVIFKDSLAIDSDSDFEISLKNGKPYFNQVGGFLYIPLIFVCKKASSIKIKISTK